MLKSYEAIYDNGHIQWLGISPRLKQARVLVVIAESDSVEEVRPIPNETTTDALLAFTNGIWGHKSIAEVTAVIIAESAADEEFRPTPNGARLAQILRETDPQLMVGIAEKFCDPIAWQNEQRKEHALSGREEEIL